MNYIINPAIFYWINVLDSISTVLVGALIIGGIGIIAIATLAICCYSAGKDYKRDDSDWKTFLGLSKAMKILIPCYVLIILIAIFIPDKTTCYQILVAKYATIENTNLTIEALKSAVDYIVEAIGSLK